MLERTGNIFDLYLFSLIINLLLFIFINNAIVDIKHVHILNIINMINVFIIIFVSIYTCLTNSVNIIQFRILITMTIILILLTAYLYN